MEHYFDWINDLLQRGNSPYRINARSFGKMRK